MLYAFSEFLTGKQSATSAAAEQFTWVTVTYSIQVNEFSYAIFV